MTLLVQLQQIQRTALHTFKKIFGMVTEKSVRFCFSFRDNMSIQQITFQITVKFSTSLQL